MSEQEFGEFGFDDGGEYSALNLRRAAEAAHALWARWNTHRAQVVADPLAIWVHVAKAVLESYREWGPQIDARFALSELRMRLGLLEERAQGPLRPKFSPADALALLDKCVQMAARSPALEVAGDRGRTTLSIDEATQFLLFSAQGERQAMLQQQAEQLGLPPITLASLQQAVGLERDRVVLMRQVMELAGQLWPQLAPFSLSEHVPDAGPGSAVQRPGLERFHYALLTAEGHVQMAMRGHPRVLEAMRDALRTSLSP